MRTVTVIWLTILWGSSVLLRCNSVSDECADWYFKKYNDNIYHEAYDLALDNIKNAYLCDTLNEDMAFEYAKILVRFGQYDRSNQVLRSMAGTKSLYPYLLWQLSDNKKNGQLSEEIIHMGLARVRANHSDFSYFVSRLIAEYLINGSVSSITYISQYESNFPEPYQKEMINNIKAQMKESRFDFESMFVGRKVI